MSDHFWSVGSPLFWVAVCHCAWLTELSVPQPVNQPVLGPRCSRQGWVLSMLPPSAVRTGLGKPRWDVLAFRHHPLQEGRGRWEEGLWVLKPPTTATTTTAGTRRRTGPFSKPQRGDEGWGGEGTRPPGAPSRAPSFNFHLDSLQTGQPLWQVKKPHSAMYVQPMLLVWIFIMNNIFITPQTVNETLTDCKIPVHSLIMNCFF